jgi:hypothetical protein
MSRFKIGDSVYAIRATDAMRDIEPFYNIGMDQHVGYVGRIVDMHPNRYCVKFEKPIVASWWYKPEWLEHVDPYNNDYALEDIMEFMDSHEEPEIDI